MKLVTQEASMGCGIACTASLIEKSYKEARKLFTDGDSRDKTRGFYNKDFKEAFAKVGIEIKGCSAKKWGSKRIKPGTIVFVGRCKTYKVGHFLLKTEKGWMDPWKTGKTIKEAQAGYRRILPGKKNWVIETKKIA